MKFPGHLHVHTEYSALDGLATVEELITKAEELEQEFIAITDHGSSSGLYEASKLKANHAIKILLGEEFYYENPKELNRNGHLIVIAKNQTGLRNLFKLQALANDNFYYKPRINLELLSEHREGLIVTTACIANQVGQYILMGEDCLALNHIFELKNIFGDDFYVELQSSTNPDVIKVNKKLESFCKNYDLKPIVTNDVHYVNKEDYNVHEVLLCIQQKSKMDSPKRWRFEYNDFWLKSDSEMSEELTYIDPETLSYCYHNLKEIADKCEDDLSMESGNYLPKYLPTKEEEDNELSSLVWSEYTHGKIRDRGEQNKEFKDDLLKELSVISETGYSGYFLIVREYIDWAKKNNILVGDGRGSGAGCKVGYTIGITEVNPQKHGLLFERFLTPTREPDYDVDFSDIDKVFKHLQDRYGHDNVARVGAFNRFSAKSAIRSVMGVYGFTQAQIAKTVGLLPKRLTFTLKEALSESKELALWFDKNKNIYEVVKKLEGKLRTYSTHAGGVIICEGLEEILPVITDSDDRTKKIIALDKKALEDLGHYKFDILGLNSLTLMENVLKYTGHINWQDVDFEDENIYSMLCEGDVLGVFQLSDQRDKVIEQQPKNFQDLVAINALIRPGVCDWNEYLSARRSHKETDLPEYMQSTHGLIVYQDQYLQLANTYAGWEIGWSDKHIRKNKDILHDDELKEKWLKDTNGAIELWNEICKIVSGGYGFNKAHSTSYAMLTYQTAYMKYYYPKEFYAAYMTQNIGDAPKLSEIINTVKSKGIKLIPPDINISDNEFIPTEDGIAMPLTSIKGFGESALQALKDIRPITDLEDLLARRQKRSIKSNNIKALIKAGCFDNEASRKELLFQHFGEAENLPKYEYDKEVFGFYVTSTPFDGYNNLKPFSQAKTGETFMTMAVVTEVVQRYDKKGNLMAFIQAINNTDSLRIICFASTWKKINETIKENDMVFVKGKKDGSSLIALEIERANE